MMCPAPRIDAAPTPPVHMEQESTTLPRSMSNGAGESRRGRASCRLVRTLGIDRAAVVGHDMGLTVAVEMLCRHEAGELGFGIDGLVLSNGSHLVELAQITQLQKDLMT